MNGGDRDVVFGSMDDFEATMARVSASLGLDLALRNSLYLGGNYYLGHLDDGSNVRVRQNLDLLDDVREITGWPGPVFVELDVRSTEGRDAVSRLLAAGLSRISRDR